MTKALVHAPLADRDLFGAAAHQLAAAMAGQAGVWQAARRFSVQAVWPRMVFALYQHGVVELVFQCAGQVLIKNKTTVKTFVLKFRLVTNLLNTLNGWLLLAQFLQFVCTLQKSGAPPNMGGFEFTLSPFSVLRFWPFGSHCNPVRALASFQCVALRTPIF